MSNKSKVQEIIEKEDEGPTLDYKEDLTLQTDGDKAQFIKDVLSLANSGQNAHIIIGVEDGTKRLVGIKTNHKAEQLNYILKNKCDPPLTVEYSEKNIMGYEVGVIEFTGENPPYIVSVTDQFGGSLSSNPQKSFQICRGTVFVRTFNKNEGASRVDLDKMYKIKYVILQADVQLLNEVEIKPTDGSQTVDIKLFLHNLGEVIAADTLVWMQFTNVKKIVSCRHPCKDMSKANEDIPTIGFHMDVPIVTQIRTRCGGVILEVERGIERIEARVIIGSTNMRTKAGPYIISLKEHSLDH
jgi:hypothetical protein